MQFLLVLAVAIATSAGPSVRRPVVRRAVFTPIRKLDETALRTATVGPVSGKLKRSTVVLETEKSPEAVWKVLTGSELANIWHGRDATFRVAVAADGSRMSTYRGLEEGQMVFLDIHALPGSSKLDVGVGFRVDHADPLKREIGFSYTNVGPASGAQVLRLEPILRADGRTGTRVVHVSDFRGRSLVEHLIYPRLHGVAVKAFYATVFAAAEP